nr:permease [Actinomycetota bacterium]
MVQTEAPPLAPPAGGRTGVRRASGWGIGLALLLAAGVVAAGRSGGADLVVAQTFVVVFTSIVIEALPFILLGALVSAVIAVYVPERTFARVARLPLPLQLPSAALGGFAFPVCECGSVPVARRLIARGMHPAAGIAFMLASPILNPIVLASTAIAYRGLGLSVEMVGGRLVLGLAMAIGAGWVLGGDTAGELLRERAEDRGNDSDPADGATRRSS